jgi:hypothetical protein
MSGFNVKSTSRWEQAGLVSTMEHRFVLGVIQIRGDLQTAPAARDPDWK